MASEDLIPDSPVAADPQQAGPQGFDFDGDDAVVLDVGGLVDEPEKEEGDWLICKALAPHAVGVRTFKEAMKDLWCSKNCDLIRHIGGNLFLFWFHSARARDLVLHGGPWFFERHMLALNTFHTGTDPHAVIFSQVPFWVQLHDIPTHCHTKAVARAIGNGFNGFIEWDHSEACKFGKFFRIRVWVKIDAPLRRGQMLRDRDGSPVKVSFKYEKLRNFCYNCGSLVHVLRDCSAVARDPPLPFGPWLRADSDRSSGYRTRVPHVGRQPPYPVSGEAVVSAGSSETPVAVAVVASTSSTTSGGPTCGAGAESNFIFTTTKDGAMGAQPPADDRMPGAGISSRKRSGDGVPHLFNRGTTGVSPPLKKVNSENGLGMASAAPQHRPPQ